MNSEQNEIDETIDRNNIDIEIITQSSSKCSTRKKILISIILVILILGGIVGVVIALRNKGGKEIIEENTQEINDNPNDVPNDNPPSKPNNPPKDTPRDDKPSDDKPSTEDNIIVDITRKLHQVLIYDDTISKSQNIVYEGQPNSSSRILDEMLSSSTIHSKYMLYIYEIDESNIKKIYNAFAFLLSFKKEGEVDLGVDIRNGNEIKSNIPMLKFSFDNNGTIIDITAPENSNPTLISHIRDFIEKIIPDVTTQTNEDLSKNYSFDKKNNVTHLNISKNSLFGDIEDSKEIKNFEINVKEGYIDNVKLSKRSILSNSKNNHLKDNSNFTAEVEGDNTRFFTSLIKEFNENIDSDLTLSTDSYEDENLYEKINSLIKDFQFDNYEQILFNVNKKLKDGNVNNKFKRHLDTYILDPFAQPIIFTYPLFKANFLGINIGLFSRITFSPSLGLFQFDVDFNRNGEEINIMNEQQFVNFDEILDKIDEVLGKAGNLISKEVLMNIDDNLNNVKIQLDNELNKLFVNIDKVPDFSNCMVDSYEELYNAVLEANAKSFEQVINNSQKCDDDFNGILTAINKTENVNINNILKSSKDEINKFINDTVDKADKIYNYSSTFFTSIMKTLNYMINQKLKPDDELEFDICTFYDIRDILDNIYDIFNNFKTQVTKAIENENYTFYTYIDDEFETNIEIYLKKVEYFADRMEKNNSIIQSLNKYYKSEETGNEKRISSIETIRGLRNKINEMIKLILKQVNDIYEERIYGDNSDFNSIFNTLTVQYNIIYNNGTELMQSLRNEVKFDENYTIYIEDINTIFGIYYDIYETKRKSYKEKIIDKLDAIGNDYLNEKKQGIKNYLLNDINEIIDSVKKLHYQEAKDKVHELTKENGTFDIIVNTYLEKEVKEMIINKYSNETFIKELLNNFYSDVIEKYNEFNNTYLEINFKQHSSYYMARPTEAETKLRQIKNKEEKEGVILLEKLTLYIIECINRTIKESYESVYNTWKGLIDSEFYKEVPKNIYGYSGNNESDYEEVENEIEKASNYLYSQIEKNKDNYRRTKEDQFNIKSLINDKEYEITSNLGKIINSLEIYFNQNLCIAHEINCKNGNPENLLSSLQQYQYQVAKTRESISDLNSLIPISRKMLGDEVLSSLDPNEFSNLYNRGFNYEINDLIKDINEFLAELNKETIKYMDSYVTNIQTDLMNSFYQNINFDGLKEEIENIALDIFVDPLPFRKEVANFMKMGCGPIARAKQIYNDEINYFSNKNGYYFDAYQYNNHFNQLLDEINEKFSNESDKLLEGITVSQNIKDEIYDKIEKYITNGYNNLIRQINDYTLNFEFLDMDYSLENIIRAVMDDEEKKLKEKVNLEIDQKYDYYLEILVRMIKENLEKNYKEIIAMMNTQYNAAFTLYSASSNVTSTYKLKKLEDSTYETYLSVITDFFIEIKKIYTENSIMIEVGNAQKVRLEQFNETAAYIGLVNSIRDNLDSFENASLNRYTQEKLNFSSNIISIIVKAYNNTLDSFISNSGKDYIDSIYKIENEINIGPEFDLLNMTIDNSYDYIISLLNTSELAFISKILSKRLSSIFGNIKSKLNEILPPKIDSSINQKLDMFTDNVEYLIPTNFIDKIINIITSQDFISRLNKPKVQTLLPTTFSDGFKANLTTIFASKLNIDGYKENFKTQITDKLNQISNTLTKYNQQITFLCGTRTQTIIDQNMKLIREDYEEFEKSLVDYKEIYNLPVGQNKKDSLTKFLKEEIYPKIKLIIDSFEKEKKEQENNITKAINDFSASGVFQIVETDLSNTNISVIIDSIEKNLNRIMNNLTNSIEQKFNSIGVQLKNLFTTPLTGFTLKSNRRMRNLQSNQFDIKEINLILDDIQAKYNDFRDDVLTNHNFVSVYTKIGSFKQSLNNSAKHISEYFYSYQLLLSDYIDPLIALNKIETEAESIKKLLYNWLTTQTGGIGNTVESIKQKVINSWKEAKTKIDNSLTNSFHAIFNIVFSKIGNLNSMAIKGNQLSPDINPIYLYNDKGEVLLTVKITLNDLDLTYKYDFKKSSAYDMNVFLESTGKYNATFEIITGDGTYQNILKDVFGSGIFSVNPQYYLYDKSVEATINIKNEAAKYSSIMRSFNENERQYYDESIQVYEFPEINDIGWVKVYKNIP